MASTECLPVTVTVTVRALPKALSLLLQAASSIMACRPSLDSTNTPSPSPSPPPFPSPSLPTDAAAETERDR